MAKMNIQHFSFISQHFMHYSRINKLNGLFQHLPTSSNPSIIPSMVLMFMLTRTNFESGNGISINKPLLNTVVMVMIYSTGDVSSVYSISCTTTTHSGWVT